MYTDKPTLIHIQGDNAAEMTPCIAYYRVSTHKQGRSGLGLEAQRKAVAAFTCSRGWGIVREYTEIESGKRNDRPRLIEAIAEAKKVKGKLVIAKLDRLARSVHFISGLMETRVDFVAVDMPNADKFMLHIFAAMAEEEAKRISQRTKAALAAAKARGTRLGQNGKVLAEKNKKAALVFALTLVPVIGELRADGYVTVRQITSELNRRGIPSREGRHWHLRSTSLLLGRIGGTSFAAGPEIRLRNSPIDETRSCFDIVDWGSSS